MSNGPIYVIASESDDWGYYWQKDIDNLFNEPEELETIADLEIGQCYHVDDGRIVIRVEG